MKIFLTGGTGFIGSHFLRAALEAGHDVLALRRSPASRPVLELSSEPAWLDRAMDDVQPADLGGGQALVHLASPGVSPQKATWAELTYWNVHASARLLEVCRQAGVRRAVIAGTCLEYGASGERYEFIPPDAPLEPTTLYGASKAAGFLALSSYARVEAMEFYYGRIFSAYGEGQFSGNFWPSLRQAALAGKDFSMTSGRQVRDFLPVQKAAAWLLDACTRADITPGLPVVENIGSGEPLAVADFARAEWSRLGATGRLLIGALPDRANEVYRFVPLIDSEVSRGIFHQP